MAKLMSLCRQLTSQTIHTTTPFQLLPNYQPKSFLNQVTAQPIYLIPHFLTSHECDLLRAQADSIGFHQATVDRQLKRSKDDKVDLQTSISRKDIRNNLRLIFDHKDLADQLFQRLKLFYLPIQEVGTNLKLDGCNPRMKIYQYQAGQYFKRHRDGIYLDPETGKQSQYTFMVYLNDLGNSKGGETQFHSEEGKINIIIPRQGLAVIFFHNLIHEGLPIIDGHKYVLRSDLMYISTSQKLTK